MVSVTVMILFILVILVNLSMLYQLGYAQVQIANQTTDFIGNSSGINQTRVDLSTNPNFTFFNESSGLPSYWYDPLHTCIKYFSCTIKFTDGWNDYVSFSLSTSNSTNNTWSSIYGEPIVVNSQQKYQLVSHMKLNKWATQSHVSLEGYNETSKRWYQLVQCPSGANGPVEWREFACIEIIPENTSKIRPVLNAGWSSHQKEEATTWFDAISLLTNTPLAEGRRN